MPKLRNLWEERMMTKESLKNCYDSARGESCMLLQKIDGILPWCGKSNANPGHCNGWRFNAGSTEWC